MAPRRVHLVTYGCQMNEHDSALIAGRLAEAGYALTDSIDDADAVLFNTCCVRAQSEDRVYGTVNHLRARKAAHPELVIGVGGCMVQRQREAIFDRLPHVDFAWGTNAVHQVVALLDRAGDADPVLCVPEAGYDLELDRRAPRAPAGPRGQVSVMRGCDKRCAFCIVPHVRGPQRSKRLGAVVDEVQQLIDAGTVEIMLLGQNVNAWGKDLDANVSFADLLAAVDAVPGIERLRFTTSHPRDMTPEIIEAMAALPTVCEHLHLPVQSGSDHVLKGMRRNYRRATYLELTAELQVRIPALALTTDIIVGFPGETDADLEATRTLMDEVGFHAAFVFKYSPRPETSAFEWTDEEVPDAVIRARHADLLEHQKALSRRAVRALAGTTQEVLVTEPGKEPGTLLGKTRGHKTATLRGDHSLIGRILPVRVTDTTDYTLCCEPLGAAVA